MSLTTIVALLIYAIVVCALGGLGLVQAEASAV